MNVIRIPSPNLHQRTMKPTHVVMHIAEGGLSACDAWLTNPESNASAHYCVGKDGTIHQYVDESDAAWANGAVREPRIPLPSTANPNLWTISIEHEGYSGEAWTDAMYAADAWLLRGISQRWGIPLTRDHIIGHCDLDSVTRANCPGTGLDWDRLLWMAKGGRMRLGMHLLTKASNQLFGNDSAERTAQVDVLRKMGITDVKLVTDGDSQLKAAKFLSEQGFRVLVRFYKEPINTDAVPDDQLRLFAPYIWAAEGYINEPEIEWNRPPTAEVIDMLARAWIRFADACGRCGVTPVTPSIQGDRCLSWFRPMVERTIALVRKDTFDRALIGVHPRPANNLPGTPPPGFVARSYETFSDVCRELHIPPLLVATEWGYEPGDAANQTLPPIDAQRHAEYNVRLAQMEHPDLLVGYYWTWLHDWFDSGWWRGSVEASLPVVKAFIDMLPPDVPEPDFPPEPSITYDTIRRWCWDNAYPGPIPYNPDAAFQRWGNYGAPVTVEHTAGGWTWQGFAKAILACRTGDWGNIIDVGWTE